MIDKHKISEKIIPWIYALPTILYCIGVICFLEYVKPLGDITDWLSWILSYVLFFVLFFIFLAIAGFSHCKYTEQKDKIEPIIDSLIENKTIIIIIISIILFVFIFQTFLRYDYKIVKNGNQIVKIDKLTGNATKKDVIIKKNVVTGEQNDINIKKSKSLREFRELNKASK